MHGEGLGVAVGAVAVDAADDELGFFLAEEPPGLVRAVGEVNEEDDREDADDAGDLDLVSIVCRGL